ncbi:MAG: metallophosphoesterase [Bacteroidota bacterium]
MNRVRILVVIASALCLVCLFYSTSFAQQTNASIAWRFAVIGDTHVGSSDTLAEMIPWLLADSIDCLLLPGDIVEGGLGCTTPQLRTELESWENILAPLTAKGIGIFPIRGNHEADARNNLTVWNSFFSGSAQLPQNGPVDEVNRTYSFTLHNALFIALDQYQSIHTVNQDWLDEQLEASSAPHIFVFGHEPAFKVFHADCLDDSIFARDRFWQSLTRAGVQVYFCGHDHFIDVARIDDHDGDVNNDVYQYLVGTGGGWRMDKYSNYNGDNGSYTPERLFHEMQHGYTLVEVSGDGDDDRDVRISWKPRRWDSSTASAVYDTAAYVLTYTADSPTGVRDADQPIPETALTGNYPNPMSSTTTLRYVLNAPGQVSITIHDIFGQQLCQLLNAEQSAGWKQLSWDAGTLPTGIYMAVLRSGSTVSMREIALIR